MSSDGGLVFLERVEARLGLVRRLATALRERRHPGRLNHSQESLLRQRVLQIACGYEDANDAERLRDDPLLKLACGRRPLSGRPLASQPTLSRWENRCSRTDLLRLAYALGDAFIASYARPPRRLILDLDDTPDVVHGSQQLALFNAFVGEYCYQPLHIYEGRSGRLITAVLRPGRTPSARQTVAILRRVVAHLRRAWPHVAILLRADGHFAGPELYTWCEQHGVDYVINLPTNSTVRELGAPLLQQAQERFARRRRPVRCFAALAYQAQTWSHARRLIVKAEVSALGDNLRFLVTNRRGPRPRYLYQQVYAARGQSENFIKNHKRYLASDRTSCHRFAANQFRLFLHSAAYVLLRGLQELALGRTTWQRATFDSLQKHLLKVATRVVEQRTRVHLHFPLAAPCQETYRHMHAQLQLGGSG